MINYNKIGVLDPVTLREIIETGYIGTMDDVFQTAVSLYAVGFRGQDLIDALVSLGFEEREAENAVKKLEKLEGDRILSIEATQRVLSEIYINATFWGKVLNLVKRFLYGIRRLFFGAEEFTVSVGLGNSPFEYGKHIDPERYELVPIRDGGQYFKSEDEALMYLYKTGASRTMKPFNKALSGEPEYVLYDIDTANAKFMEIVGTVVPAADIKEGTSFWGGQREVNFTAFGVIKPETWKDWFVKKSRIEEIIEEQAHNQGDLPKDKTLDDIDKELRRKIEDKYMEYAVSQFLKEQEDKLRIFDRIQKMLKDLCQAFMQSQIFLTIKYTRFMLPRYRKILWNCRKYEF